MYFKQLLKLLTKNILTTMKNITFYLIVFLCFGPWSNAQNSECNSRSFDELCEVNNPARDYTPMQEAPQTRLLGDAYYIQNGNPWGQNTNQTGMDLVFGAGNWTQVNYSVDPSSVFNGSTAFVFIEGSDGNNDSYIQSFMSANQGLIESWVSDGGNLYIKAGTQGPDINVGFGNTIIDNDYSQGNPSVTVDITHPSFIGPYTPTSETMSGNWWFHNDVRGTDITPIVLGGNGTAVAVGEKTFGGGNVVFSGGTMPNFQSPQPQSYNFHYNLIYYAANANPCDCPVIQCPADIIVDADAGLCSAIVNFAEAVAIDPTGVGVTVEQTSGPVSGSAFPVGETEIEFTATSAEGTSTCSFVITVVDNQLPEITCAPVTVSLGTTGEAIVDASAFATATDNCDIESIEIFNDFGDVSNGDKIYFTTSWSGGVWEANRDGTQAIQLYQTETYGPVGIEADLVNGFLYWAEGNYWEIAKAPIDGSGPIEYLPVYQGCCEHHDLEIDYNTGDIYYTTGSGGLYKYDAATGNNINLSDNNYVYAGLSLDKTNGVLYFHDDLDEIYSINTDGSGETLLYSSLHGRVRGIMYDEVTQNIYWWDWVNSSSSRIYYAPSDGSGSPQILFDTNQFPISGLGYHMDLDQSSRTLYMTYFDNDYDDYILTAPIDGTSDPVSIYSPGTDNGIRGIAAGLNMNAGAGWSTSGVFSCDNIGEVIATIRTTDVNGNQAECTTTITVVDDTAPEIICDGEPLSGDILEDFEGSTLPNGWTNTAIVGTDLWSFGSPFYVGALGQAFPTNAAVFDDDAAGSGNANTVELASPVYDLSGVTQAALSFDYAYNYLSGDAFYVEVFDGTQWVEILRLQEDHPVTNTGDIDMLPYANDAFQVRFTYDDGDGWMWGVGIDNFHLTYFAPSSVVQVVLDSNGLANYDASDLLIDVVEGCDYTVTVEAAGVVSGDLTTLFAGGNGGGAGGAVYFDVTAVEDVSLTALDLHTGETGAFTVEVYAIPDGTYVGNENNAGAWTLVATGSGDAQGAGTPSLATLDAAVSLTAGTTYGMALVMDADHGHDYTNGDGTNQNYATPELEFAGGSATNVPFTGNVFSPRVFNGRFYYDYLGTTAVENFDFDCSMLGINDVEVTVTDSSGNVSTCISQVEVIDVDDPILVCQDATVSLDENGMAEVLPEYFIDTDASFDACGITITAVDVTDVTCADVGASITVTVFVSDDSGNIASCQATMTVVDDMEPVLDGCPEDMTVDPGAVDLFYEVPDYTVGVTATDNCSDPSGPVTQDPPAGTLLPDGVYTVTLSSTDDEGNVGTCSFELTVESVLGVASNQLNAGVAIYPNPARNLMNIGNSTDIQLERAVIYDLNGRMIQTIDLSDMSAEASVNVAHLASGVYMVQLQAQDGQAIKRLIKE